MVYTPLFVQVILASGLLASTSFAIPVPVVTGQVVNLAPSQNHGQNHEGHGANIAHPHIVLGQEKGGNTVLAPVTSAKDNKNGPSMRFEDHEIHHDIKAGSILLSHVTTDPANLPQNPLHGGAKVHDGVIQKINDAKVNAAKQGHTDAEKAHDAAFLAHEKAAQAHYETANHYDSMNHPSTTTLAKEHRNKALEHTGASESHLVGSVWHEAASKTTGALPFDKHHEIKGSMLAAEASRADANDSAKHAKAATHDLKTALNTEDEYKRLRYIDKAATHAPSMN